MRGEGDASMVSGNNPNRSGVLSEDEIIEIEGKMYKRVQIEGNDQDFLMDEDQNIYDMKLNKVGEAGESDDDEAKY